MTGPPDHSRIRVRPMEPGDIPFGMHLKEVAGWNQLQQDWQLMLRVSDGGAFVAEYEGEPAGTAVTIPYEDRFSWVSMVLVLPDRRRRGIGRTLLEYCIAHAEQRGAVRLDATPQGKKLYDTLGFEDEYRLVRTRCRRVEAPERHRPPTVQPALSRDLDAIVEFDAPVFGAGRRRILASLMEFAPRYGWVAKTNGRLTGYCLGRPGSRCDQIGPLVTESPPVARELVSAALGRCEGKDVIVDVLPARETFWSYLQSRGFEVQRRFIRMCKGRPDTFGIPEMQYAIAGPELG